MIPSAYNRLRFETREENKDGFGNVKGEFQPKFSRFATLIFKTGGEGVLAARLSGVQPIVIQVYDDSETRTIKANWRAVNEATGDIYSITSPPMPVRGKRVMLEMMAQSGVPS